MIFIHSRKEKSDKPRGAQTSHKPHSLENKLDHFINSLDGEEEIIEVNKNKKNKNKRFIEMW